jgi:hypothetical protein
MMRAWLVVLGGFAAIVLVAALMFHYRAKRLARKRRGIGFDDFAVYFSSEQIPRDKLFAAYEYLQGWQSVKDFPVLATDDLCKVYGICEEDVDDAVIDLADKWRVALPADFAGAGPVNTVADLVRLLANLPYGRDNTPI